MNLSQEQIQHMVSTMSRDERKDWVQTDAYETWMRYHFKGTIEAATGVGKTRIGVMATQGELLSNPDAVIYIVVPTTTLKTVDWPDEFRKWGCKHLLKKVHIITHAMMHKTKSVTEVDLLIFDEVHHFTPTMEAFFVNNKVYKVLGLTATLPDGTRSEEDQIKRDLIDQYCPSIYKVSLEEAIALELVADFEIKVLKFPLDNVKTHRWKEGKKEAIRTEAGQYKHLSKQLAKTMYNKKYAAAKFKFIQKRVEFIRNLPSKQVLSEKVMKHLLEPGKRTLIFCGSIEQSNKLCGTQVYNSKTDDKALTAFQNKEIDYLGAVDALNEGKNIIDLDQLLIIQGTSVALSLIQRLGRMLRIRAGHKGLCVVLIAKDTADEKWWDKACSDLDPSRIKNYIVNPQTF